MNTLHDCIFQLQRIYVSFKCNNVLFVIIFSLSNFAEFPMASLHEGVFLHQSHAESYLSMFSPQIDMVDNANVRRASGVCSKLLK